MYSWCLGWNLCVSFVCSYWFFVEMIFFQGLNFSNVACWFFFLYGIFLVVVFVSCRMQFLWCVVYGVYLNSLTLKSVFYLEIFVRKGDISWCHYVVCAIHQGFWSLLFYLGEFSFSLWLVFLWGLCGIVRYWWFMWVLGLFLLDL